VRAVMVLLVTLAAGGCSLFGGDAPDRTCRGDNDCFRAQGERCNQANHTCEVMIDAAVSDAPIDAPAVDASIDADLDAGADALGADPDRGPAAAPPAEVSP